MDMLRSALVMNPMVREAFQKEERRRNEVLKRRAIHGANATIKIARAELKRARKRARNLALVDR